MSTYQEYQDGRLISEEPIVLPKVTAVEVDPEMDARDIPVVCRVCGGTAYAQDWVREAG